jgi:hypothetical protein
MEKRRALPITERIRWNKMLHDLYRFQ